MSAAEKRPRPSGFGTSPGLRSSRTSFSVGSEPFSRQLSGGSSGAANRPPSGLRRSVSNRPSSGVGSRGPGSRPRSGAPGGSRPSTSRIDTGASFEGDFTARPRYGYHGYGAEKPRKYVKGELKDGHKHISRVITPDLEYKKTCKALNAEPNSHIYHLVTDGFDGDPATVLGATWISLNKTYLGEKGFIALLPLLDRNTNWTSLDASRNGLRNEAVLHLVDLLLRPPHRDRDIYLDLSGNPISETGGRALLTLAQEHPSIGELNLRRTKVPQRIAIMIRQVLDNALRRDDRVCPCGEIMMADAQFCKICGHRRDGLDEDESEDGEVDAGSASAAKKAAVADVGMSADVSDGLAVAPDAADGSAAAVLADAKPSDRAGIAASGIADAASAADDGEIAAAAVGHGEEPSLVAESAAQPAVAAAEEQPDAAAAEQPSEEAAAAFDGTAEGGAAEAT
mmetsp:Transcript_153338/g.491673  ORF Transcript_153338/g.491673 Transcript_153338/m.491673 type:complete len:453 (+) Transcript_153338:66-1424(+)